MKLWRTLGISLAVALALLLAVQGRAFALVEQLSLDELTAKADAILVGEVTDIASYQEAEGNIYTLVTLSVEQTIKGESEGEVVIKLPGGEVDGLGLWVEDVPSFQLGEKTVVFLEEVDNAFGVSGWYQGKFTVRDNRVVERNQSLTNFMVDISQAMEAQGITPKLSVKPFSMVLESPVESKAVEPAKTEEFLTGWQNIMTDGFEGAFPGVWTAFANSGPDAYWGKDNYRYHGGSYSAFCAKNGTAGVNPPSDYPNNMSAWMVYGPFSLVDATDAKVDFWRWLQSESGYDYVTCMASTNGTNFYGTGWDGDSGGWQSSSFDLTDVYILGNLCGQSQVWIAFIFTSDDTTTDKGAFIDDVVLQKYVAGGTTPQITLISPSSGPAGTGFEVTITGTNFGASQGSSTVTFWLKGSEYVEAPIVSWSDTQIRCQVPSEASSGDTSHGVRVTTSAGISNDYPFTTTFSYFGHKWPGTNPTVGYLVNPNTPDTTGELTALQTAFQTWNNVSGASFNFGYAGATGATDWGKNGQNEIMWVNNLPDGAIAVNYGWFNPSDPTQVIESDILFNDAYYDWSASPTCPSTKMDVENVAAHELGHTLILDDLYGSADSEKTMYGFGDNGQTKCRTLHADDIAGISWIYPGATTPPTVSSSPATNVASTSATLNGSLSSKGTASTVYASFEYGLTTAYGNETTPQAMTTTGPFSFNLSSLSPNTTYHFRGKAVGNGTSYGLDKSFTTPPDGVPPATSATRDIADQALAPGETTQVTVIINVAEAEALALDENPPAGWMLTRLSETPGASAYREITNEWVWFQAAVGAITVVYNLSVPLGTPDGIYEIAGTLISSEGAVAVGGDSTMTVGLAILAYYRGLGDDPNVVETQDLLKAANDWANEVIPPGFSQAITTQQLLQLANEWAAG